VLLSLDQENIRRVQLAPDNNAHLVSQPVVHFAWSATHDRPDDIWADAEAAFPDATNFRRAFESYQLVILQLGHSASRSSSVDGQWDRV
jgi:hypothetical protein